MNKVFAILTAFVLFFSLNYIKIFAMEQENNENIYTENAYFKVTYSDKTKNKEMPINSLNIYSKKNNELIEEKVSTAISLKNGNLLLGYFSNNIYKYYELDKNGEKSFLIDLKYFIKDINLKSRLYEVIEPYNINENEFNLGFLDYEFNVIYEPIFIFNKQTFKDDQIILQIRNDKFGLFSTKGKTLIEPVFDTLKFELESVKVLYNNRYYTLKKENNTYINVTSINEASEWAKKSVYDLSVNGIVSENLQLKLKENITREEFCQLIINLYEKKTNSKIKLDIEKNPFIDTSNLYVLKAYSLKLVSGKSENEFKPQDFLTREEACVILNQLRRKMGIDIQEGIIKFKDEDKISTWAKESVDYISSLGVMLGDSKNYFNPKNFYTVEQSLSSLSRFFS